MRNLLLLLCCGCPALLFSQSRDSTARNPMGRNLYKPEILSSGFIDIFNNGQVNASARLIRLYIGEPGKFALPLSIYSGVSSNSFQNQFVPGGLRSNEQLAASFINPLSGLVNVSAEGLLFLKRKAIRMTRGGILYHAGSRLLTGYRNGPLSDPATGKPVNFLNGFGSGGFYFQTGAWDRSNTRNLGVCWIAGRYILCKSATRPLKNIFDSIPVTGYYHGWSAGWGVEINNLVNIKLVYYKYVKAPETGFASSIYQFSFIYSLR